MKLSDFEDWKEILRTGKDFPSWSTPPIAKICVKNARAWVSMVSYLNNIEKIMLKIWKKSWEPFGSCLLNPDHFHQNWAGLAVLSSRQPPNGSYNFFHIFSTILSKFFRHETIETHALAFLTHYFSYRGCGSKYVSEMAFNFQRAITKGQIISKWYFGVFDFLQKSNENKSTWGIIVVKSNCFVRFLEENEDTKNHFEIIWPLVK